MKILVVEDDRKVAGFIEQGLREEGYVVDVAPDAAGSTRGPTTTWRSPSSSMSSSPASGRCTAAEAPSGWRCFGTVPSHWTVCGTSH